MKPIEKTAEKENVAVVPNKNPKASTMKKTDKAEIGKITAAINKFKSQLFPP